jgi:hypothetical protein
MYPVIFEPATEPSKGIREWLREIRKVQPLTSLYHSNKCSRSSRMGVCTCSVRKKRIDSAAKLLATREWQGSIASVDAEGAEIVTHPSGAVAKFRKNT